MPAVVPLNKNTKGSRHHHPPPCFLKIQSECTFILSRASWKSPRWLAFHHFPKWQTRLCGFCHDAVLLSKKNLRETPPKQPCFLLTPSFSLLPPQSRQRLSFGDMETASKLVLPCTHGQQCPHCNKLWRSIDCLMEVHLLLFLPPHPMGLALCWAPTGPTSGDRPLSRWSQI